MAAASALSIIPTILSSPSSSAPFPSNHLFLSNPMSVVVIENIPLSDLSDWGKKLGFCFSALVTHLFAFSSKGFRELFM